MSSRGGRLTLPATGGWQDLLSSSAPDFTWRTLHLWAAEGRAFEAEVEFGGGGISGSKVALTVAPAARLALPASGLRVRGRNLSTAADIEVFVHVVDGMADTRNVLQRTGTILTGLSVTLPIPPFAQRVILTKGPLGSLGAVTVQVVTADGAVHDERAASAVPAEGLLLGDAREITLINTGADILFRAVFLLSL